jgi:hypothetical protein
VNEPQVDYGDAKPLGRWQTTTAQAVFETEAVPAQPRGAADAESAAGAPAAPSGANNMGTLQPLKGGGAGAAAPSGAPSKPIMASAGAAAPSGGETKPAEMKPAEPAGVTSVQFSVTTESLGGRYKPKNIGAIWVTNESGKLVKSLEVWARVRLRYLTKYASARASARPDVTATATLTTHKAHMATWDLKDSAGASVPPGKYTLNAEITDADVTGKNVSVAFDTSAGAMTISPPSSTGFTAMELVLK